MLSPLTRQRLRKFRSIKRAWWSLWILAAAYVLSLLAGQLANDRPFVLGYEGRVFFPSVKFYPATTFGGAYATEADYVALREDPEFRARGGWMLLPPVPHSPFRPYLTLDGAPPHPPSAGHWLGTDNSARDILSRLIHGFRNCMTFALALAVTSTVLGIIIGAVQGYLGGWVDLTIQRLIEIWSALPFLYVVILFGSIYGQSFTMLLVVMTLFEWIALSFYMRGEFLKLRQQPFVIAARGLGAGGLRIVFRQMLPNAMTPVITLLPFMIVAGISALTALDFLGFGLPPPAASWGEMIQQGLQNLQAPWVAGSAVAALFLTLLLATFVGEGVRDAFDPKERTRLE